MANGGDARAKLDELQERAQSDPVFARRFETDPEGTLRAEGIPAGELTTAGQGDVAGHSYCSSCWTPGRTCVRTGCGSSHWTW